MTEAESTVSQYTVRPLSPETWEAFAQLAGRPNGGTWQTRSCWCTWFHTPHAEKKGLTAEDNRCLKERLVSEGRAHAALVFDGDVAVAWCEYGTPDELPNIYHRKEYEAGLGRVPDYRITCLFVDKRYRHKGVAAVAISGAMDLIAHAGGGVVEAYPQDTPGKKVSDSFLYNGIRSTFDQAGFSYERPKGIKNCVMSKTIPAG
jgi:GNAT superfamily N-acetyltransferase